MAGTKRYSRKMIERAIVGDPDVRDEKGRPQASSRGVKSTICARLGCSRQTLDNYLVRYPELDTLIEAERETIVDLAENKLLAALNRDDMRAILFVLETMGKKRGWSKRTEITGANGAPLGLPPEALELMKLLGMDESALVREFTELLQAEARRLGVVNG